MTGDGSRLLVKDGMRCASRLRRCRSSGSEPSAAAAAVMADPPGLRSEGSSAANMPHMPAGPLPVVLLASAAAGVAPSPCCVCRPRGPGVVSGVGVSVSVSELPLPTC